VDNCIFCKIVAGIVPATILQKMQLSTLWLLFICVFQRVVIIARGFVSKKWDADSIRPLRGFTLLKFTIGHFLDTRQALAPGQFIQYLLWREVKLGQHDQ
jgi:hypothetical protein